MHDANDKAQEQDMTQTMGKGRPVTSWTWSSGAAILRLQRSMAPSPCTMIKQDKILKGIEKQEDGGIYYHTHVGAISDPSKLNQASHPSVSQPATQPVLFLIQKRRCKCTITMIGIPFKVGFVMEDVPVWTERRLWTSWSWIWRKRKQKDFLISRR